MEAEVVGGRASIAQECGIPLRDIAGFRQPFLQSAPVVREVGGQGRRAGAAGGCPQRAPACTTARARLHPSPLPDSAAADRG